MSFPFLNRLIVATAVALYLALFAGCSNMVAVQGEVTLDGKPLPNAKIMLMPKGGGRPAEGTSDAAGEAVHVSLS